MNAYKIYIWHGLSHNGEFVQNIEKTRVIHARNETEAKSKIALKTGYTQNLPNLKIEVGNEFIYACEKIGTVTIEPFYVYSNNYNPISVADYKRQLIK